MRSFALIFCLLTPSWVTAESLEDLLNTLNGKVIEIAGRINDDAIRKRYIWLSGIESIHAFEYAISLSELRAFKKSL